MQSVRMKSHKLFQYLFTVGGLPLCIFPRQLAYIDTFIVDVGNLFITWPCHLSYVSLILSTIGLVPRNPFIPSFLIVSMSSATHPS